MALEAIAAQSNRTSAAPLTVSRLSDGSSDGFATLLTQSISTLGQDQSLDPAALGTPQPPLSSGDSTAKHTKTPSARRGTDTSLSALQSSSTDTLTASMDPSAMMSAPSSRNLTRTGTSTSTDSASSGQAQQRSALTSNGSAASQIGNSRADFPERPRVAPPASGGTAKSSAAAGKQSRKTDSKTSDTTDAATTTTGNNIPPQTADAVQEAQAAQPAAPPAQTAQTSSGGTDGQSGTGPVAPAATPSPPSDAASPLPTNGLPGQSPASPETAGTDGQTATPSASASTGQQGASGQTSGLAAPQAPSADAVQPQAGQKADAQTATQSPATSDSAAAAQAASLGQIAGSTRVSVKSPGSTASSGVPQQNTSQLASSAAVAAATTSAEPAVTTSVDASSLGQNGLSAGIPPITAPSGGQSGTSTSSGDQEADARGSGSSASAFGLSGEQDAFHLDASSSAGKEDVAAAMTLAGAGAAATSNPVEVKANLATDAVIAAPGGVQNLTQMQETSTVSSSQPVRQTVQPNPTDQIKVQLSKSLKDGSDTLSLQLHPADLGRVDVKLEMQNGQVKATVTADRPETLQLLKNDAGSLQQSLSNAGLSTDANSLSFQLRDDQQRQTAQNGQAGQNGTNAGLAGDNSEEDGDDGSAAAQALAALQQVGGEGSGLDINV